MDVYAYFSSARYSLIIPETDSEDFRKIMDASERESVFYDELVSVFILVTPNTATLPVAEEMLEILATEHVHIQIVAKIQGESISQSNLIFDSFYSGKHSDRKPIISDGKILFHIDVLLDVSRKRPSTNSYSRLDLTANIYQQDPSTKIKDSLMCKGEIPTNLLQSLADGQFNPYIAAIPQDANSLQSFQPVELFKTNLFKPIKIRPLVMARYAIYYIGKEMQLALHFSSSHACKLKSAPNIQMTNTIMTPLFPGALDLATGDDSVFLYSLVPVKSPQSYTQPMQDTMVSNTTNLMKSDSNLNISQTDLDELLNNSLNGTMNLKTLHVRFSVVPLVLGCRVKTIRTHIYANLDYSGTEFANVTGPLIYGRKYADLRIQNSCELRAPRNLISVSINSVPKVRVRQVFNVEILVVNNGVGPRTFDISVNLPTETRTTEPTKNGESVPFVSNLGQSPADFSFITNVL